MIDKEKGLLSCILLDNEIASYCKANEKHFTNKEHKAIIVAIRSILKEGFEVVPAILAERSNVPIDYIYELYAYEMLSTRWDVYRKGVCDAYDKLTIAKVCNEALRECSDSNTEPKDIILKLLEIKLDTEKKQETLFPGIFETFAKIYTRKESTFLADTTGYASIDMFLGGLRAGAMYIIGARPGVGKSTLMLNLCLKSELQSCILSTEMSASEIHLRTMSYVSGIPGYKIERGAMGTEQDVADSFRKYADTKIAIYDSFMYEEIENIIAKEVAKGTKLVFVDYLQQIRSQQRHENMNIYIGKITGLLKSLALKYKIAIFVLAQLNRQASEGQPTIAHLRDSGNIEQDADVVMLLSDSGELEPGLVVYIAKNRQGEIAPNGATKLKYNKEVYQITNS